jgi:hypothetical protein
MDMQKMITSKRKPRRCPTCGSADIASVLYGFPAFSAKLEKELEEGKVVLGGCCVSGCDPAWQCVECETQIYREEDVVVENPSAG